MIVAPGIEKVDGRCGGAAVIEGTRLTVHAVEAFRRTGGDASVVRAYPYLTQKQRRAAYKYVTEYRSEFLAEERYEDADTIAARAIALLRKHQWAADDHCPECGAYKNNGHAERCEWATLIGAEVDS